MCPVVMPCMKVITGTTSKVKQTLLGPIWIPPYVTLQPLVWNEAASYQQAFLENEPTFTHHTFLKCSFGILQIVFVRK